MSNMNICCKCCSDYKVENFLSKLKGTASIEYKKLCDDCYEVEEKKELNFITTSFKNGMSINDLVDIKYVKDFINPNSSLCIFNPIKKYSIIEDEETKKKYVKIEFDEYMRFLHLLVLSNTKLHTDDWVHKQQEKQEKNNTVEVKKILKLEGDERVFNEKRQKEEERVKQQIKEKEYEREREKKRI